MINFTPLPSSTFEYELTKERLNRVMMWHKERQDDENTHDM